MTVVERPGIAAPLGGATRVGSSESDWCAGSLSDSELLSLKDDLVRRRKWARSWGDDVRPFDRDLVPVWAELLRRNQEALS